MIERHDLVFSGSRATWDYWGAEINRRADEQKTNRMLGLTYLIVMLTIANVALVVVTLLRA